MKPPDVSLRPSFRVWLRGARPLTLVLSVTPVVAGLVHAWAAYRRLAIVPVAAALAAALSIQAAANLANDSADGGRGADGAGRLGPVRLVGAGLASPAAVRRGAVLASCLAAAFGLIAVAFGGAPILAVGVASLLAAWAYSCGPAPIAASPFGEAFVVGFFGLAAVSGIVWLAAGRVDATCAALGFALGLPAAAVLTVNNHRDRAQDAASARRTLAILIGPNATPRLYVAELAGAAIAAGLALWPVSHIGAGLVTGVATAVALGLGARLAAAPISPALNRMLAATVIFQVALTAAIVAFIAFA